MKSKILAGTNKTGKVIVSARFEHWPTYYAIGGGLFVLLALLSDFSFQKNREEGKPTGTS